MTIKPRRMSNYNAAKFGDVFLSPDDIASAGIPVVLVTAQEQNHEDEEEDCTEILPLPASRYRYSKWHELEDMEVSSSMLKSPRVRKAPKGYKKDIVWMLEDLELGEEDDAVGGAEMKKKMKKRKKKHDYRNRLETWENCECVNLSYQDLGHSFQVKEFHRVLRRLIRCESIQLIENSLDDLSTVVFPRCSHLFLQRNYLTSFKKLPKIPNAQHVSLQQNNISSLDGLELLRRTHIRSLVLEGNPVALEPGYRRRVFRTLPGLKLLDGLPHLPSDSSDESDGSKIAGCAVS